MSSTDQVRRIVTGHDASGKAIVITDGPTPHKVVRPKTGVSSYMLWRTNESPADMTGDADRAAAPGGVAPPHGGSIFRVVDFPSMTDEEMAKFPVDFLSTQIPHEGHEPSRYRAPSHPFMHRTRSIDYAVVLSGEIDMKLDDAEEVHMKAGDVLIQQGTNHAWINRSGKPCRIAFILIDAAEPLPD